ncbi:MAG: hypothetical protein OEY19_10505 [Gammaproteobacteria bacterium]|nr:hypothetical protein [Gammaproteobacteria bacterium]MDH5629426.1 hypothetical protein [Gammaproteobacteria bacterium]
MKKLLIPIAFFVSNSLMAEENEVQNVFRYDEGQGWFMSVGYTGIDSETAFWEGIGDSGTSLKLGYGGHTNNFVYGFGMSWIMLSDKNSFSQTVQDNFGNTSTKSSSADAFGGFGELGYSYVFDSGNTSFDLLGGFEFVRAERTIANCSNCLSENINLDSGLYVLSRFTFFNQSGSAFSLGYQKYMTGDFTGGIDFRYTMTY